jgi:hypothetical protein
MANTTDPTYHYDATDDIMVDATAELQIFAQRCHNAGACENSPLFGQPSPLMTAPIGKINWSLLKRQAKMIQSKAGVREARKAGLL